MNHVDERNDSSCMKHSPLNLGETIIRNTVSWVLRLGLVAGFGVSAAIPDHILAKDNPTFQQERCVCDCGGETVYVTPTAGAPNEANCKAMSNKTCRIPKTGANNALTCGGSTIVAKPRPGMPQVPLQSGPPIQRR